tara:strand:+ start:331 stop:480 length:150 start_codon:yes stop_codon:yes gene_type:complete
MYTGGRAQLMNKAVEFPSTNGGFSLAFEFLNNFNIGDSGVRVLALFILF